MPITLFSKREKQKKNIIEKILPNISKQILQPINSVKFSGETVKFENFAKSLRNRQ